MNVDFSAERVNTQPAEGAAVEALTRHFIEELRTTIFADFQKILTEAEEQFRQHDKLFKNQTLLAEALCHKLHDAVANPFAMNSKIVEPTILDCLKPSCDDNGAAEALDAGLAGHDVMLAVPARESVKSFQAPSIDDQDSSRCSLKMPRRVFHAIVPHHKIGDITEIEYHVEDFYQDTGLAQSIARSDSFANITLTLIILNAIYIGYDVDHNRAPSITEAKIQFQVCEYFFCVFFVFEWLVRFLSFKSKRDCLKDIWLKFDASLVFMMLAEATVIPLMMRGLGVPIPTSIIKLVRLLRVARMARVMRAMPELVAMMKGVRMALRAVCSALLLLLILVYVFAVMVFVLLRDRLDALSNIKSRFVASDYFGTLPLTMWTLFVDGAFMDSYGFLSRRLLDTDNIQDKVAFGVLVVFVLASALTVMNMLIGVLCQVVTGVAQTEKEEYEVRLVKETLLKMLLELDTSGDGKLSWTEMETALDNPMSLEVLLSLEVDPQRLMQQAEMQFTFKDKEYMDTSDIIDLILALRGDRAPTIKDMFDGIDFQLWKAKTALEGKLSECFEKQGHIMRTFITDSLRASKPADKMVLPQLAHDNGITGLRVETAPKINTFAFRVRESFQ